ncbi:MAG: prepilin peptidase [Propionibacteriaceae bacterium]
MSGIIGACIGAIIVCAIFPALLDRLRPPDDEPEQCYRALATNRLRLTVTMLSLGAGLIGAWGSPTMPWAWWGLSTIGVIAAVIDVRTLLLPLRLTHLLWGTTAVTVIVTAAIQQRPWLIVWAVSGALIVAGGLGCCWRFGQLGFGDVRLGLSLGALAALPGWSFFAHTLVLGSLTGAAWGLIATQKRHEPFPYGPSLVLGPYLALVLAGLGLG